MKGVSVVICCYNSAKRLPETLDHLNKQEFSDPIPWEIIVVDNASTDGTVEVAQSSAQSFRRDAGFNIVQEKDPGLSNARKKGLDTARYSYILFCDDDNWLSRNYLRDCFRLMESDETIGACGGKGIAKCEIAPPEWFALFPRPYAVGAPQSESGKIIGAENFLTGAGMFLRRAAWVKLADAGFQSLLQDRKGNSLSSGGDLELCYVLQLAGYDLYYLAEVTYQHFIPKERLSLGYLRKLHEGIGRSNVLLTVYHYLLNGMATNKRFIWLRVLSLLSLKTVRAHFNKSTNVVDEMNKILTASYFKELLSLKGEFDLQLQKTKELHRRLSISQHQRG